ncbi:hypothetical protein [Streptomyces griseoluteus]|uniref:hypothetical protein n=1 Tax=Streptomyces griseoluteus TaxID=29306 RepID=UPI00364EE9C5
MAACRPWPPAELRLGQTEVVGALGATAGKALPGLRVTGRRGVVLTWPDPDGEAAQDGIAALLAAVPRSAVLRAEDRDAVHDGSVAGLRLVADVLRRG